MSTLIRRPSAANRRQPAIIQPHINPALGLGLANGLLAPYPFALDRTPITVATGITCTLVAADPGLAFEVNETITGTRIITFPILDVSTRAFTFFCRIKLYQQPASSGVVARYGASGTFIPLWRTSGGAWDMRVGGTDYTATGTWNLNQWYSVAIVGTASACRLYVDGSLVIDGGVATSSTTGALMSLGDVAGGGMGAGVSIQIASFLTFDRAWTERQVRDISENPSLLIAPRPPRFFLIPSAGNVWTLTVADASHSQTVDAPTLTQAHVLALADTLHSQTVDAPTLTLAATLVLNDATHAQTADGALSLTQAYLLAPADTAHSQTADAPTVSTGLNLALADALHSQSVEAPTLTQAHVLALADALHSQTVETLSMGQGFTLIMGDGLHSQTADAPILTQAHVLTALDALHTHLADAPDLIAGVVVLVVSDALHTHLAGAANAVSLTPDGRILLVMAEDRLFLVLPSSGV